MDRGDRFEVVRGYWLSDSGTTPGHTYDEPFNSAELRQQAGARLFVGLYDAKGAALTLLALAQQQKRDVFAATAENIVSTISRILAESQILLDKWQNL